MHDAVQVTTTVVGKERAGALPKAMFVRVQGLRAET
jgi:hypothetical protein